MVEKFNKKLKAKGNATTACPGAKSNPKRKVSGGSSNQVPKKAHSEKFYQRYKAHGGPYQAHNTSDCCCYDIVYDKDGKPLSAAACKWEDKAIGQGATHNAGEDYWPWSGRSPMVGPTPIRRD